MGRITLLPPLFNVPKVVLDLEAGRGAVRPGLLQ